VVDTLFTASRRV